MSDQPDGGVGVDLDGVSTIITPPTTIAPTSLPERTDTEVTVRADNDDGPQVATGSSSGQHLSIAEYRDKTMAAMTPWYILPLDLPTGVQWSHVFTAPKNWIGEFIDPVALKEQRRRTHAEGTVVLLTSLTVVAAVTSTLAYSDMRLWWLRFFDGGLTLFSIIFFIFDAAAFTCLRKTRYAPLLVEMHLSFAAMVSSRFNDFLFIDRLNWICHDADNRADCTNRIELSPFLSIIAAGSAFVKRRTLPAYIGITIAVTVTMLQRLWAVPFGETLSQAAAKDFLMVGAASIAIAMTYGKQKLVHGQVERVIAAERAQEQALKRRVAVDEMLNNMLPKAALGKLINGYDVSDVASNACVTFSDIKGFTDWASSRSAKQVVQMLNTVVTDLDALADFHKVIKIKTIGDAYWAVAGISPPTPESTDRVCSFALDAQRALSILNSHNSQWNGVEMRFGVHTGKLEGSVFGTMQFSYEVFGETNAIAAMVEQRGLPGAVVITSTSKDSSLVGLKISPHSDDQAHIAELTCPNGATLRLFVLAEAQAGLISHHDFNDATIAHKVSNAWGLDETAPSSTGHNSSSNNSEESSKKRAAFLNARRLQNKDAAAEHQAAQEATLIAGLEADIENLRNRKCASLAFTDEELEQQFLDFARKENWELGFILRIFSASFMGMVVLTLFFHPSGDINAIPAHSWFLLILSCIAAIIIVVLYRKGISTPTYPRARLEGLLLFVNSAVFIIALGLIPYGAQTAANELNYLFTAFALLNTHAAVNNSNLSLIAMNLLFLHLPMYVRLERMMDSFSNDAAKQTEATMVTIFVFVVSYSQERILRIAFVESKFLQLFDIIRQQQLDTSRMVLTSVVPRHVVPLLETWQECGYHSSKEVAIDYEELLVAFVQFNPPLGAGEDVSDAKRGEWMQSVHSTADRAFLLHGAHFVKIKTIGDTIMLAGPFVEPEPNSSPNSSSAAVSESPTGGALATSALHMLSAIIELQKDVPLRAGLHCGSVVAAVLGTTRLAFDVFGDTVNVASRAMTTSTSDGRIAVTEEFFERFVAAHPDVCDRGGVGFNENVAQNIGDVMFEAPTDRKMKGKGQRPVREVGSGAIYNSASAEAAAARNDETLAKRIVYWSIETSAVDDVEWV